MFVYQNETNRFLLYNCFTLTTQIKWNVQKFYLLKKQKNIKTD